MGVLKFFAVLFLVPGLIALVAHQLMTNTYLGDHPRTEQPDKFETVPHELNGATVYLTEEEENRLHFLEYYGLRSFLLGLGLGLVYMGRMATHLEAHAKDGGGD